MSGSKRTIRGLQDIRTHAGKVDKTSVPHKAYLRIACLELERFRRDRERESALRRVKSIDERCQEIETEQDVLLQAFGSRGKEKSSQAARNSKAKNDADVRDETKSFKIQY